MVYPSEYDGTISDSQLSNLENGNLWFNVTSTNYPGGLLTANIPPLRRSRCSTNMASVSYVSDLLIHVQYTYSTCTVHVQYTYSTCTVAYLLLHV